ncbi:MAG: hypothetical protein IT580_19750, partial [Verrucomicrobiales bacterium]|nr:hypothetical protein [Verrucomicrobiales bacterium]
MNRVRFRDPRWCLILGFLAILGVVPLAQVALETRQGDGIRMFDVFSQAPTASNLRAYEHSMEEVNWAARASRPWMQWAQFAWLGDGGAKAALGRDGWYFYKPGVQYSLGRSEAASTTPPSTTAAAVARDPLPAIVDFRDQLQALGIQLVVMPVPNKESIYPDRLTARAAGRTGVMAPRTRELMERLREARVEVIDLFEAFTQARQTTGPGAAPDLYLAQDTHWSPAGMTLAARTAARRLVELGWVRPGAVEYDAKPAPVQRLGDIVRMLQSPPIEARVRPETVACEQVFRRDNGRLFEEAVDAEVLVVGDSFLRIYQRDEPGTAGFIAHLGRELRQPLISLVNDGGG